MPNDTQGQQPTTISMENAPALPAIATPNAQAEALSPLNGVQLASNEPAALRAQPQATPHADVYNVVVKAPPAGGMLAYLVGPGAQIQLEGIDLNKATIAQEGGNLRITLPNGAEVLLLDYVNSAHDSATAVITPEGKLPAQALLHALDVAQAKTDVEPAAGPSAGGEGGGLLPPTILGLGVGEGEGIFSSVIGPYAIPRPTDAIFTNEYPFEPGLAGAKNPPVGPVNHPPLALNDSFSTAENTAITMTPGQLLANDSDPDGDPLTIISVQGPTHGTVAIVNGNVVFTPEANFHGTGSYSYTISDGHGGTSTADVIIQIDPNPVNENNVIAADDAGTVVEGRSITINVLANDSDPEGDALVPGSVRIIAGPQGGQPDVTAHTNPDGTITFSTVDHHSLTPYFVTLEYEVSDARGARDTATVTVEVIPSANNVIAVDDTGEIIPAGATKAFNVTGNDYDPQNDSFKITSIVSGPARGSATFDAATGNIVYHSVASNTGYTEVITYEITDDRGAKDQATLTIRVEPSNNVSAVDDTADMKAGQDVRIEVLKNDFDAQGDAFHITRIVSQPTVRDGSGFGDPRGSVTINADGTITYTDAPGARNSGVVEFTYEIEDSKGALDTAVVRVTIGTAPNGVDANNDTLTMAENSPRTNVTNTILANDFDPQNDAFHITSITQPTVGHGTVELVGDQVFFTPANGYHGPVVFTYTITDALGATDTAQVSIDVQPPLNTSLNAGDDSFSTPFNTNLVITAAQVLANDNDPEGTTLNAQNIISVTQPLNGSVTYDATSGQFLYNPNDTFRGTDSFTYTIRDAQGDEATATVTIRVADPNPQDNPVNAVDDTYTYAPSETRTFNVLTNDSAPDGGLQFVRVTDTLPAGVTNLGNGIFSYTAPAGGDTTVTFHYEVRDIDGDTDVATVTLITTPKPFNNVIANDDTANDVAAHPVTINVLANDTDPQGDTFSITAHTNPSHGTVVQNANGTFTYTAAAGYQGVDTFTYTITDSKGATDTATVTINVGPNTVVAVNDDVNMAKDVNSILVNAIANDFDPQGDAFSITRIVSVDTGTAVIENGQIRYNNTTRDAGTAHIVYEITDQYGATSQATVTVHITADTNNVIANDDTANDVAAHPVVINVLANDTDPQGDAFSITSHTNPSHGTVVQNANGTFTYTAVNGYQGIDTFTYTITDAKGATDTATVTINVGPNTVVAVNDDVNMAKDVNSILVNAIANDFDPQGDAFSITRIVSVDSGTATIENGQIRYTNPSRDAGTAHIVYEITDQYGATSQATVTVHIAADTNSVDAVNDVANDVAAHPVVINVLANDSDPQGDAFSITSHTNPSHGSVVQNANGTFTYTAVNGYQGVDTFTYTITDAKGATDTATVTINVSPNTVVAVNDNVNMDTNVNSILVNAKGNDFDPQGDAFSITRIVSVDNGTATIENGQIRYTNPTRDAGVAHVVYEITDQFGATSQATVTVNIAADFNNVIANDDSYTVNSRTTTALNVKANDVDPQGDEFHVSRIVSGPAIGSAHVNANGTITYVAGTTTSAYNVTFTYEVIDAKGATDTATVTIHVNAGYTPPSGGGGGGGDHGGDCPLTIDLNGDGIAVSMLSNSTAHFDLQGNGSAEWTAWVSGSDDAILAIDRNDNGAIDGINEVFGGHGVDGFSELGRLEDSNSDGIVDSKDANWSSLKLWLDANHDGITQAGELHALSEFGITGIHVASTGTSIQYGDAYISQVGTIDTTHGTLTGGTVFYTNNSNGHVTGTAGDDTLVYNTAATSYEGNGGHDTIKVMQPAGEISLGAGNVHGVDQIDLSNNGADNLHLNVNDILAMSSNGILTVNGDAVDQVTLGGDATRGGDVTQGGHTYASYSAGNGGTVLIDVNVHVTQEQQH